MPKNISNSISKNIKKYRLISNMTQEELAGRLNLDTQYYAQLERGERNFTIEKIVHLCSIFHIGIEDIIEIESTENENPDMLMKCVISDLKDLSYTQLAVVAKFITEIVPYIK